MISREKLPQIPGDKVGEFIQFCNDNGVSVEDMAVHPKKLRAIQSHVNRDKVDSIKQDDLTEDWIGPMVAQGGYILDGHHRWIAWSEKHPDDNMGIVFFHCPITKLVELGHKFEGSHTASVYEIATYRQMAQLLF
jgi:hypothetical protein